MEHLRIQYHYFEEGPFREVWIRLSAHLHDSRGTKCVWSVHCVRHARDTEFTEPKVDFRDFRAAKKDDKVIGFGFVLKPGDTHRNRDRCGPGENDELYFVPINLDQPHFDPLPEPQPKKLPPLWHLYTSYRPLCNDRFSTLHQHRVLPNFWIETTPEEQRNIAELLNKHDLRLCEISYHDCRWWLLLELGKYAIEIGSFPPPKRAGVYDCWRVSDWRLEDLKVKE